MKDKINVCFCDSLNLDCTNFDADLILIERRNKTLNFKRELSGQDQNLLTLSNFSKKFASPIFVAVKTDNYGQQKRSVAVFERGKLLAICDANFPTEKESLSFGYKVIKTTLGKIGVLVSKDIICPDAIKSLVMCESELILNLFLDIYDFNVKSLIPSISYMYATPIISTGTHGVLACESRGRIGFFSENAQSTFQLYTKRNLKIATIKTCANI